MYEKNRQNWRTYVTGPWNKGGGENQRTPGFSVKTEGGLRACHSDKGS